MADNSGVQWAAAVDMESAKQNIRQLSALLSVYYRAVLAETNNQALTEKLTIDYQRILLGMTQRPKE